MESSSGLDSTTSSRAASSVQNKIGFGSLVIEGGMRHRSSDGSNAASPEGGRQTREIQPSGAYHTETQPTSVAAVASANPSAQTIAMPSSQPQSQPPLSPLVADRGLNANASLQMTRSESDASSMTVRLPSSDQGQQSPPMPVHSLASKTLPVAFPIKTAEGVDPRLPQRTVVRLASTSPIRSSVVSNSQSVGPPVRRISRGESPSPTLLTQGVAGMPIVQKNAQITVRQASPVSRRIPQASVYNTATNVGYPVQQTTASSPSVPLYATVANASIVGTTAVPVSASGFMNWDV